jgi:hypothetical protein
MPSLLTLNRLLCNALDLTICVLAAAVDHLEAHDPATAARNRDLDDALRRHAPADAAASIRPRRVEVDLDVHGTVTLDPDTLLALLQDIAAEHPGTLHPECCRGLTGELMHRLHEIAGNQNRSIEVER